MQKAAVPAFLLWPCLRFCEQHFFLWGHFFSSDWNTSDWCLKAFARSDPMSDSDRFASLLLLLSPLSSSKILIYDNWHFWQLIFCFVHSSYNKMRQIIIEPTENPKVIKYKFDKKFKIIRDLLSEWFFVSKLTNITLQDKVIFLPETTLTHIHFKTSK